MLDFVVFIRLFAVLDPAHLLESLSRQTAGRGGGRKTRKRLSRLDLNLAHRPLGGNVLLVKDGGILRQPAPRIRLGFPGDSPLAGTGRVAMSRGRKVPTQMRLAFVTFAAVTLKRSPFRVNLFMTYQSVLGFKSLVTFAALELALVSVNIGSVLFQRVLCIEGVSTKFAHKLAVVLVSSFVTNNFFVIAMFKATKPTLEGLFDWRRNYRRGVTNFLGLCLWFVILTFVGL